MQPWWNSGAVFHIGTWGGSTLLIPILQTRKINSLRVTLPGVVTLNSSCVTSALTLWTTPYDFSLYHASPYSVLHINSTSLFHRLVAVHKHTLLRGEDWRYKYILYWLTFSVLAHTGYQSSTGGHSPGKSLPFIKRKNQPIICSLPRLS